MYRSACYAFITHESVWKPECLLCPKYLLCKLWAECSGMGQHEAGHIPPPGTKIQAEHQN